MAKGQITISGSVNEQIIKMVNEEGHTEPFHITFHVNEPKLSFTMETPEGNIRINSPAAIMKWYIAWLDKQNNKAEREGR